MRWVRGFLDNNSLFGRVMTRCGILIAANLLFLLGCVPVVTAGAAWAALYYTLFKTLREGEVNPFRTFWQGFRDNFRQATAAWGLLVGLGLLLGLELFWCSQFTGPVALFRYGLLALLMAEAVLALYLFPVMAAFQGTIPTLLKHSLYFAFHKPLHLLVIVFFHVFPLFLTPLLLTYWDTVRLPLYAFVWCTVGCSAVAMSFAAPLLRQFTPLLSPPEGADGGHERSQGEILEDMKKLGM